MNIFEYLGLPAEHRKTNKITQLVKHYVEVSDKYKTEMLYGQVKKDGCHALFVVKDKKVKVFSRTGKAFKNMDVQITVTAKDGVYSGEVRDFSLTLEEFSGKINPNTKKVHDDLTIECWFFDYCTIQEFIDGVTEDKYTDRHKKLMKYLNPDAVIPIVLLYTPFEQDFYAWYMIQRGEEGVVLRHNVPWVAGHKNWRCMKKVRSITYDLLCIGIEEGTGKYEGKAANLLFRWKDGTFIRAMLGKGWTHADAEYFFHHKPVDEIFEVYALQESSKGVLRLPKVGEQRHDKVIADY